MEQSQPPNVYLVRPREESDSSTTSFSRMRSVNLDDLEVRKQWSGNLAMLVACGHLRIVRS